jgi:hypothetical protein
MILYILHIQWSLLLDGDLKTIVFLNNISEFEYKDKFSYIISIISHGFGYRRGFGCHGFGHHRGFGFPGEYAFPG